MKNNLNHLSFFELRKQLTFPFHSSRSFYETNRTKYINRIDISTICKYAKIFGLKVYCMVNSRHFTASVLNCCFEFTKSRKKDAYFSGFESRNKLIKVDNSAAILFRNKVSCVSRRFMYLGIAGLASFFSRTFLRWGALIAGALHCV